MHTRREFLQIGCVAWALPLAESIPRLRTFAPPLGVCRGLEDTEAAKLGGAEYLECSCSGDLQPEKSGEAAREVIARLRASLVPLYSANSFLPGRLRCTGPEADHAAVLAYAERVFERAAEVAIGVIVFGSSRSRSLPEGFAKADAELQFVSLLARMAESAKRHEILVCVEPLQESETNFINTLEEARRIVAAIGHPNIALCADIFHMLRAGEGAASIEKAGALVRHVHIAENLDRAAPGTHGEDFTPYLQALKNVGYRGRISIECGWKDFGTQLPKAREELRRQLGRVN